MGKHTKKDWHPEAKQHFKLICGAYDFNEAEIPILYAAIDQLSRFFCARDRLNAEGLTFTGPSGLRAHPCVTVEKQAFKNFLQGMRLLGVKDTEINKNKGGRPLADAGLGLV